MKFINKFLIFILILFIGLSFSYAVDNTTNEDDTVFDQTNTNHDILEQNKPTEQNEEKTIINENKIIDKENKTLKKESQTIILNSTTFDNYVTDQKFNEKVSNGDTIDIQGILYGTRFTLEVNKAVNITSSTNDAFITNDMYGIGGEKINNFIISENASGTNISNIKFHNTHIYTTNAHNITITNISADCNASVGQGRGMISIRDGSTNVNITNSYFETRANGGHSNVVFAFAHECLFENNIVVGHGWVGNLIYITTYGSSEASGEINTTYGNTNITIRNNYIDGRNATDSGICIGVAYEGANHTIVNNTILKTMPYAIQVNNYGTNTANITFEDNYCPTQKIDILNVTDNNYEEYGSFINETYVLNENVTDSNLILNLTNITRVYSEYNINLIAINSNIGQITLNYDNITINDVYAPKTIFNIEKDTTITNSTLKSLNLASPNSKISNNIIINQVNMTDNPTTIYLNESSSDTIIENNYLLSYNSEEIISGNNSIMILNNNGGKIKDNSPSYQDIHILNTTTYDTLFDENNILKNNINGTIILTESIESPIIINKAVNITTQKIPSQDKTIYDSSVYGWLSGTTLFAFPKITRTIPTYTNITFTAGSQESNITNSYINNIIINTDNINIQNNTIDGNITINSNKNNITNNNITNNQTYSINIAQTSINNTIHNNTLNALYNGDLSIYYREDNQIQDNIPYNNVIISTDLNDELQIRQTPIKINVTSNNESVTNGYVVLILNGIELSRQNITNGSIETTITPTTTGKQTFKIYYFAEKNYNNNSITKNVTVRKSNVNIQLESEGNLTIGETVTFTATVLDEYQETLNNETLTFIVNNNEHNITINDGIAIFTAKTNDTWLNGIYAKLYTTEKYNTSQSNTITLAKGEAIIKATQKIINNTIQITAYITDSGNTPLTSGYIRFRNGTKTLRNIAITDGIASYSIAITDGIEGTVVSLNLISNNAFNTKSENITLTLNPPIITQLQLEEITGNVGEETTITATVTTDDNTPVNEGTVTFIMLDYNETVTVTDGVASTTHTFTQTVNDTVKATYNPLNSDNYYESTNTTTIIISKQPEDVTITIQPINTQVGDETTITTTVTTTKGELVNEGTITLNTTNYTEIIQVTNGIATTTHTFTQALNNLLTVTYNPENPENYNTNSNTTTIIVIETTYTLKVDTTTFTIGENATIQATIYLNNKTAENINKGKVVFKINGKTLKDSNGKVIYAKIVNGTATIENYYIPATWNKENLTIEAVYSGSNLYGSLRSDKQLITIEEPTPTITTEDITATKGETITLKATVKQGNTLLDSGKVVFKINGKTVKDANGKVIYLKVENGQVTTNYTIPTTYKTKTYTITATYIATGYDRLESTKTLTITA